MTPRDISLRLQVIGARALSEGDDATEAALSRHANAINRRPTPEVAAGSVILARAELVNRAQSLEARAAKLREWARQIGEE